MPSPGHLSEELTVPNPSEFAPGVTAILLALEREDASLSVQLELNRCSFRRTPGDDVPIDIVDCYRETGADTFSVDTGS